MALPADTVKTSIYIPTDQWQALSLIAERDQVATAQVIRNAFKQYIIDRGFN